VQIKYYHGDYGPGDLWGWVGADFSGAWKDPSANRYAADVQNSFRTKPWRAWLG
jgi:hypothetical protein